MLKPRSTKHPGARFAGIAGLVIDLRGDKIFAGVRGREISGRDPGAVGLHDGLADFDAVERDGDRLTNPIGRAMDALLRS